jgi:tetratricopeptide (TPR) repeat protein
MGDALGLTVALHGLDRDRIRGYVAAVSGGMSVDDHVVDRLAAHTNGSFFALQEYFQVIVDAGLARPHWGTWRVDTDGLARLRLPQDAADLIRDRVLALGPEHRRLLGAAAVLGHRFTTGLAAEIAGSDLDPVGDAVAGAAWHHLVDDFGDGVCGFVHEQVRVALLDQLDAAELRSLHDRAAEVLERHHGDDPARRYAVAGHRLLGAVDRDPDRVLRACVLAARQALADHAPAQAVSFLEPAVAMADADVGVLRTLATGYQRAGRFDDALRTLHRALAASSDRFERAWLLYTIASVHDSTWNTAEQVAAVRQALAELGRPLPKHPLPRALSTLWLMVVGYLVGRTGIGRGTASGPRRELYRLLIALYDVYSRYGYRDQCIHRTVLIGQRSVYLANRVGNSPESARTKAGRSVLARLIGLTGLADRLTAQATRMAAGLGDRAVGAYVAWTDAVARYGSGQDSGESILRVIDDHRRWLDPGHHLDCYHMLAWDLLLRGDTAGMQEWLRRRDELLATGAGQSERGGNRPYEAGLPALRGQGGQAGEHLRGLRGRQGLPAVERLDLIIASLQVALEQREVGAAFDEAAAEFEALGLTRWGILPTLHAVYVYLAYGRVEQCRAASGQQLAARTAVAKHALRRLREVANRPLLAAHHRVLVASLREVGGDPGAAMVELARAEPALHAADAPLVAFEAAMVRARALRALGVDGEAARQADVALRTAKLQGWPHRVRWVEAEFTPHASGELGTGIATATGTGSENHHPPSHTDLIAAGVLAGGWRR